MQWISGIRPEDAYHGFHGSRACRGNNGRQNSVPAHKGRNIELGRVLQGSDCILEPAWSINTVMLLEVKKDDSKKTYACVRNDVTIFVADCRQAAGSTVAPHVPRGGGASA